MSASIASFIKDVCRPCAEASSKRETRPCAGRFRDARIAGRVLDARLLTSWFIVGLIVGATTGCANSFLPHNLPLLGGPDEVQNPLLVNSQDQEFLWAQITDELDDYFKIRREERIRIIQNVLTDGWVETYPTTGASLLEPWRKDAVTPYERWLGTFQSIRRWARVEVSPIGAQYKIEVFVYKELEDLDQPVGAGAGDLTLRHDTSLEQEQDPAWYDPDTYGWIFIGRDHHLEQQILQNIEARLDL